VVEEAEPASRGYQLKLSHRGDACIAEGEPDNPRALRNSQDQQEGSRRGLAITSGSCRRLTGSWSVLLGTLPSQWPEECRLGR